MTPIHIFLTPPQKAGFGVLSCEFSFPFMHNSILVFAICDLEGILLVFPGSESGEKGGESSTLSEFS